MIDKNPPKIRKGLEGQSIVDPPAATKRNRDEEIEEGNNSKRQKCDDDEKICTECGCQMIFLLDPFGRMSSSCQNCDINHEEDERQTQFDSGPVFNSEGQTNTQFLPTEEPKIQKSLNGGLIHRTKLSAGNKQSKKVIQVLCTAFNIPKRLQTLMEEKLEVARTKKVRYLSAVAAAFFLSVIDGVSQTKQHVKKITRQQVSEITANISDMPKIEVCDIIDALRKLEKIGLHTPKAEQDVLSVEEQNIDFQGKVRSILAPLKDQLQDPFTGEDVFEQIFKLTLDIVTLVENRSIFQTEPNFITMAAAHLAWQSMFFNRVSDPKLNGKRSKKTIDSLPKFLDKMGINKSKLSSARLSAKKIEGKLLQMLDKMTWINDRMKIKSKKFRVARYLTEILQSKDETIAAIDADNQPSETFPPGCKPKFRIVNAAPTITTSNPSTTVKSSQCSSRLQPKITIFCYENEKQSPFSLWFHLQLLQV